MMNIPFYPPYGGGGSTPSGSSVTSFINRAAFPTVGVADHLYIAADTAWSYYYSAPAVDYVHLDDTDGEIVEVANFAALPATGIVNILYLTLDDGLLYRWGGSAYAGVSTTLALGHGANMAFPGSEGLANTTKLNGIEDGAEVNVIEVMQANGVALPISNRTVNMQLANDNFTGLARLGFPATPTKAAVKKDPATNTLYTDISGGGGSSAVLIFNTTAEMDTYPNPTSGQHAEVIATSRFETATPVVLLSQFGSGSVIQGSVSRANGDKLVVGGTGGVGKVTAGNQFETNTTVIALTSAGGTFYGGLEDNINRGVTIFGSNGEFAHVGEGTDFSASTPVQSFTAQKTINGGIADNDGGKHLYCNEGYIYYVAAGAEFAPADTPVIIPGFITNIRCGRKGNDGSLHLGGANGRYSTVSYGNQFTAATPVIVITGFGSETIRDFIEDDNGNKYLVGTNGSVCYESAENPFTASSTVFTVTGFGTSAIKSAVRGNDGGLHFFGNNGKACFIEKDTTLIATSAVTTINNFSAGNIESAMVDSEGGIVITGNGGLVSQIAAGQRLVYLHDGTGWILISVTVPASAFGSGDSVLTFKEDGTPVISKTGTIERCTAIKNTSQTISSEAVITFNPNVSVNTDALSVNANSEIVCNVDGFYSAMFRCYCDEYSDPSLGIWVEKWDSTLATPAWVLIEGSLNHNPKVKEDISFTISFDGGGNLYAGDKIRVKGRAINGFATLKNQSLAVDLGIATQYACTFTLTRQGANTIEV